MLPELGEAPRLRHPIFSSTPIHPKFSNDPRHLRSCGPTNPYPPRHERRSTLAVLFSLPKPRRTCDVRSRTPTYRQLAAVAPATPVPGPIGPKRTNPGSPHSLNPDYAQVRTRRTPAIRGAPARGGAGAGGLTESVAVHGGDSAAHAGAQGSILRARGFWRRKCDSGQRTQRNPSDLLVAVATRFLAL
jgi:hypothetical protein